MTNLKSVDNYSIPVRDGFVLCNCNNGRVNSIKFIAYTAVPNFLPFFLAVHIFKAAEKLIFTQNANRIPNANPNANPFCHFSKFLEFAWPDIFL